jgi:hypoxanthine-DNA glycosylase
MQLIGFPAVAGADSRVLILGSMPSVASLAAGQYYAHPRNAFWPIVFALWHEPCPQEYSARTSFLTAHKIALWDSAASCQREGSLDSNMRNVMVNDFETFFKAHAGIQAIFFNGAQAKKLFMSKYQHIAAQKDTLLLPSTSPAAARVSFPDKLRAWQRLREACEV